MSGTPDGAAPSTSDGGAAVGPHDGGFGGSADGNPAPDGSNADGGRTTAILSPSDLARLAAFADQLDDEPPNPDASR
jgi:hypothetical protein